MDASVVTIGAVVVGVALIAVVLLSRRDGGRRVGGGDYRPNARPAARSQQGGAPREVARLHGEPAGPLPDRFERLSEEQLAEVEALLHGRRKIEAIKLVREATGLGLKEAKEAVEDYERRL